jgi:hypothetical protein
MRILLIAFLLLALIPTAAARAPVQDLLGDCTTGTHGAVIYCTDDNGDRKLAVWANPCPWVYVDHVAQGGIYCWP